SGVIPIFEEFDNSLSDNFSPEFETFCDHTEETRSDNTNIHANDSLPEYDSFCFEIELDQERLINVLKSNIFDESSNDPLLEEVDLFLASDNSIHPGIKNFADNSKGDIRFLEELLINDSSQISSIHAVAPILSIKEPEYSPSMGYENSNTTLETESDEIMKSDVEELVPILSENEVTLEDKRECDVPIFKNSPICDDHSEIFSDSKNDDDILVYNDDFEDIEYVEASLFDPEIVSVEEENVVHQAENDVNQEEEEVDLEDIFQIQDVILREKLLSITRLISNIESLNDNPIPDLMLNSSVSILIFEEFDNSLSDNFSPEFETFCDHTEETRSDNTNIHANDSLPEYDSFCF
nr:hypothetical protein [Tanacetum cinerariifolium]